MQSVVNRLRRIISEKLRKYRHFTTGAENLREQWWRDHFKRMDSSHDAAWAHGLARWGLGVDIALHGLTRLPNLSGFAKGLQEQFAATFLPAPLVFATGYGIAIGEAAVGILLVLGLFLRPALVAGSLLMILLLFGTCLTQNWNAAGIQLMYLAFYCGLLASARCDRFSVDNWLAQHE